MSAQVGVLAGPSAMSSEVSLSQRVGWCHGSASSVVPRRPGRNYLQPQQHYALRARGGSGHGSPPESALLFLKCVNSLFIGQECSHTTSSFPLAFSSQQPYAASGTDAILFSSPECLTNQLQQLLRTTPSNPAAHTCSPFVCAPPTCLLPLPSPLGLTVFWSWCY